MTDTGKWYGSIPPNITLGAGTPPLEVEYRHWLVGLALQGSMASDHEQKVDLFVHAQRAVDAAERVLELVDGGNKR